MKTKQKEKKPKKLIQQKWIEKDTNTTSEKDSRSLYWHRNDKEILQEVLMVCEVPLEHDYTICQVLKNGDIWSWNDRYEIPFMTSAREIKKMRTTRPFIVSKPKWTNYSPDMDQVMNIWRTN